jgi:hypothetical protein
MAVYLFTKDYHLISPGIIVNSRLDGYYYGLISRECDSCNGAGAVMEAICSHCSGSGTTGPLEERLYEWNELGLGHDKSVFDRNPGQESWKKRHSDIIDALRNGKQNSFSTSLLNQLDSGLFLSEKQYEVFCSLAPKLPASTSKEEVVLALTHKYIKGDRIKITIVFTDCVFRINKTTKATYYIFSGTTSEGLFAAYGPNQQSFLLGTKYVITGLVKFVGELNSQPCAYIAIASQTT